MQPLLTVDIETISVVERLQLIEELWDSILASPESLPVTDAQKQVLDDRLAQHYQAPEDGASWESVKERLDNLS